MSRRPVAATPYLRPTTTSTLATGPWQQASGRSHSRRVYVHSGGRIAGRPSGTCCRWSRRWGIARESSSKHYRRILPKAAGKGWFEIYPDGMRGNVVQLEFQKAMNTPSLAAAQMPPAEAVRENRPKKWRGLRLACGLEARSTGKSELCGRQGRGREAARIPTVPIVSGRAAELRLSQNQRLSPPLCQIRFLRLWLAHSIHFQRSNNVISSSKLINTICSARPYFN